MIGLHDELTGSLCYLHTLITKGLATFLITLAGIDKLHLALTLSRLVTCDDPYICSNTSVVEKVIGELYDSLQPIVFQKITTDITFTSTWIPLEQRRTILNDSHTSRIFQFRHAIKQEQLLTITNGRKSWLESSSGTFFVLGFDCGFACLPLNTKRWIRNDIVEFISFELVIAQCVALAHIVGVTSFDECVGLGDSKGLFVQFLTISGNVCIRIDFKETVAHAA